MASKAKVAIVGSGNIGTDLMIKILRTSDSLDMGAMVGIDPDSDGLARAAKMGVATTHEGLEGLNRMPEWKDIVLVFDATSAGAHKHNAALCEKDNKGHHRSDTGSHRALRRTGRERRSASRRQQHQHGHLRRAGDDPDGACGKPHRHGPVRGNRGLDILEIRQDQAPAPISTSSRKRRRRAWRLSAAPHRARPSSSSTRRNRRW